MAKEMDAKGWKRAAAVARAHLSSRLHAGFLLPRAALNKKWSGVKNLATHVVR